MPFIDEIAERLINEGVGTLNAQVSKGIFKGSSAVIPDGVGPYLTLIETGGTGAARTHNNTATERPTAQLKSRAVDTLEARKMLQAAYAALGGPNGLHNVTLSGVIYLSITARQGVTDTGKDETGRRATFTFNIDAEKEPS